MTERSTDAGPGSAEAEADRAKTLVNRFAAATFFALIVLGIAVLGLRYADGTRDASRNAANLASVLSEYLKIRLTAVDGLLSRMVATSRRVGGPAGSEREWRMALRTAASGISGVSSVSIVDGAGIVTRSTIVATEGTSWADRPLFAELRQPDRPDDLAVDKPLAVSAGDPILIPFGRALTDADGAFIGAAIATLVPTQLEDFYRAFDLGPSGIAWVSRASGEVLFRAGAADDMPPEASPLGGRKVAPEGLLAGPLTRGGATYLTAYRRSGIADLVVAVSLAEKDFAESWWYEALGVLLVLGAVGVLLLVAARAINRAIDIAVDTARVEGPT
jgi:hypothetical protein